MDLTNLFRFQILKDVTNRYKVLRGYKVDYVPGWDCHGLPIEMKALQNLRMTHTEMEPLDIRKRGIYLRNILSGKKSKINIGNGKRAGVIEITTFSH